MNLTNVSASIFGALGSGPPAGPGNASARIEWGYPTTYGARKPTGFHVYATALPGSMSYVTPAATVLYSAGFANTFQTTLTGLDDGTTYRIGVRAYNAVSEETNVVTCTVTADATGPSPVVGLSASAVV